VVWNPVPGCKYYRTETGGQPVKDWIRAPRGARLAIGKDISKVQYLWPDVRRPLIDGFGRGLYEVRSTHDKNDYR
jgi:phage-related protein